MMGCSGCAAGNVTAADDFAGNDFAGLRVVLHAHVFKINRLALEQRQQQFLRHRIVAVILFQDLQRMLARRVAQDDRIRLDLRGRAGVEHGILAGLQVQRHGVAHDGEILVVNGERRLGAGRERARRADDKKDEL